MRMLPISAATLALLTTAAVAQTTSMTTHQAAPAGSPPAMAPSHATTPNPLNQQDLSKVDGTNVYGRSDDKIGHISTVLIDPSTKKVDRLVVSTGGIVGIGSHRVALPLDRFSWDSAKGGFKVAATVDSLKTMPEWVEGSGSTASDPRAASDPRSESAGTH